MKVILHQIYLSIELTNVYSIIKHEDKNKIVIHQFDMKKSIISKPKVYDNILTIDVEL